MSLYETHRSGQQLGNLPAARCPLGRALRLPLQGYPVMGLLFISGGRREDRFATRASSTPSSQRPPSAQQSNASESVQCAHRGGTWVPRLLFPRRRGWSSSFRTHSQTGGKGSLPAAPQHPSRKNKAVPIASGLCHNIHTYTHIHIHQRVCAIALLPSLSPIQVCCF